jgi:hypothetical protein
VSQPTPILVPGTKIQRIAAALFCIPLTVMLIIGVALIPSNPGPGLGVVCVALGALFLTYRSPTRGNVAVSMSGIDFRGTFRTRHVAKQDISEVSVETRTYMTRGGTSYALKTPRVHLRSGKSFWLTAYKDPASKLESKLVANPGADAYALQIRGALGMSPTELP